MSEGLLRLASNHRWTWVESARALLDSLPTASRDLHPHAAVSAMQPAQLDALLGDDEIVARLEAELADLDAIGDTVSPRIAYCSPEFGLSARLPQYSGGLGVLAGDHLKAASDAGLPLVGVGLFYHEGFFRQVIDGGRQAERYVELDLAEMGAHDTGHVVRVPLPGREVNARVWVLDVGRVPLVLLDTDVDGNEPSDRAIGDRLYSGDRRHRLEQEMVLGVGGARALAALGWDPPLFHLNEGHAGFVALEMIDRLIVDGDLEAAASKLRDGLVFTTHTPVPAGIDRFERHLIEPYLGSWAERWGVPVETVWELGADPTDAGHFNMAALTLRLCRTANGVSDLHGEVSRLLFAGVGCGDEITHVTNGVHARTWVGAHAQGLFDDIAGPAWDRGEPAAWESIAGMDEDRLAGMRRAGTERLGALVHEITGHVVDPDALVIGFARRFAPYKRATLVLEHGEELASLLDDADRPVHFLYAGKAHPMDEPGKALLARIVGYSNSRGPEGGFTFIPGYDMDIARLLVEGCDIWLNTPIRPREASGTSGQKAALNGGLNCSILDGWWAEMFDGENGWAIPESETDEDRDTVEAKATLASIASIADEYHGDRAAFNGKVRHAWRTLGPKVTAARMLRDYETTVYRTS